MQATELLIGLWLRTLKPKRCLSIVRDWLCALGPSPSANDNVPTEYVEARERAVELLSHGCETCAKDCPMAGRSFRARTHALAI